MAGQTAQIIDGRAVNDEVEFFGVKVKVRSSHLAALLNSDVTEDVVVVGRRARDVILNEEPDLEAELTEEDIDDALMDLGE
jgi:hypothetical protein